MGHAVGIDLGTTYSAAARVDDSGKAVIIPNAEGQPITPSVVWFGSDPPVVGDAAKAEQKAGATDAVAFFKRRMGDPNFLLSFNGKSYTPTDLSALVLGKIKADCQAYLRDSVTDAVITVPAYFVNAQREATIEAGRRAGLNVLRIINEPTAAALAYGVHKADVHEKVLVYDLGGGTFDVTLVDITPDEINVLATDGDHELGGKDWDDRITQYLASRFRGDYGVDPIEEGVSFNELLVRCEDAKKRLTTVASVKVRIDHDGIRAEYELTRDQFEQQTADLMERTQILTEHVLADAGVRWDQLAGVLPVGGSSLMPMVHEYVRRMSGKPPRTGVQVEQAVALGAAIQAAIDTRSRGKPRRIAGDKRVHDVMSHSLGMVALSPENDRFINSILIEKNKPIPIKEAKLYQIRTKRGRQNQLDVFIVQGESTDPRDCKITGKYVFSEIEHVPAFPAVLEVEYGYDQSGVITVAARQRSTGKSLPFQVESLPDDMSWLGSVTDVSGARDGSPYTPHAGQHHIPGAIADRFGNALGSQFDLAEDGAFDGAVIAVLHLYTGEGFDFALPTAALREKGFELRRWTHPPGQAELADGLEDASQLWLISDRIQHLNHGHLQVIRQFFESGRGIYLWGDNEPYYADANFVASNLLGCTMSGNFPGDQVVGLEQNGRGFASHLITTGIEKLYEGVTIATIQGGSNLAPLVHGSAGNLVTALHDQGGRRAILDGGFTRLFVNWDTAGTGRYVKNAASWLVNYERLFAAQF
jgi:molecular chaperone DnaK